MDTPLWLWFLEQQQKGTQISGPELKKQTY